MAGWPGWAAYASFPTYGRMLNEANFPLTAGGQLSDEFIHEVFIYGDEETIRQRLLALHQAGADEIVTSIRPLTEPSREEAAVLEILTQLST